MCKLMEINSCSNKLLTFSSYFLFLKFTFFIIRIYIEQTGRYFGKRLQLHFKSNFYQNDVLNYAIQLIEANH